MESLFVFLNVQLYISLCIGNLQMLLETELLKNKQTNKQQKQNKTKSKINQNNNNNNNNNNMLKQDDHFSYKLKLLSTWVLYKNK